MLGGEMRQFLYLDTELVNSILAQHEKGLIESFTMEKEDVSEKACKKGDAKGGEISLGARIKSLFQAEAKFNKSRYEENSFTGHDVTKKIFEKILHDATFDIAYEALKPIKLSISSGEADPGVYIEITRVFDFVDFEYINRGINWLKVIEKKYVQNKSIEKGNKISEDSDTQYDGIYEDIMSIREVIPPGKMFVSFDGYIIPAEDKHFKIDPSNIGFMYGGEMKCVGLVTNIIGEDTNPYDYDNIFATVKYRINKALCRILPTNEDNFYVVSPIAIYYEA